MSLWPVASKKNPCPICGKEDWCGLGDYKVKCMREPSDHPSDDGGFYHPYPGAGAVSSRPYIPLPIKRKSPQIDASAIIERLERLTTPAQLKSLGGSLGVAGDALFNLRACRDNERQAWAFPMYDGDGKICGIRLRYDGGEKKSVYGSQQGAFASFRFPPDKIAYLPEGPTDCAALMTLGLFAIGRPSANCGKNGAQQIRAILKRFEVSRIVIIADNDTRKRKKFGTEIEEDWSPGIDGAKALAKELKMNHVIWLPPAKDMREFVKLGGTRVMVENSIKNLIWKR